MQMFSWKSQLLSKLQNIILLQYHQLKSLKKQLTQHVTTFCFFIIFHFHFFR